MKVEIKDEIYEKIKERIKGTEFSSVEEYVNFVLEEVLKDEDEEEFEFELSEEDEEKIKERLKSLGYL
ncbi:MAG: CopG family transcriptional regulator [Candidatus Hydrothermarchaeota archaeon]|nr:MAG: CopG family transcriptional regulator [Candidatus Hydrothermarchaeota archaeon]